MTGPITNAARVATHRRRVGAHRHPRRERRDTRFRCAPPAAAQVRDYNGTEKVADLPSRLSANGSPAGVDPNVGDITYYAPWGHLAIFYRDFGYSGGLVKLGHIDSGIEKLATHSGTFTVRIELAEGAK